MAYQIKVLGFTSSAAKRIASDDVAFSMSADAMWFSGDAVGLTINETLANADLNWIVVQYDSNVELSFEADEVGQGYRIPSNCSAITVTSVTGAVRALRMLNGNYGMTKLDAYNSSKAVSITSGYKLYPGDYLVLDKNAVVGVKFESSEYNTTPYLAIPIGLLAESDR